MALLQIIEYPDPRLRTVARPVTAFDDRLRRLVADMAQTMYEAPGVGLAATQVDVHERIIVIDVSESNDQLLVFINPEILWHSDTEVPYTEGCLSVPEQYAEVMRPDKIRARWQDVTGKAYEEEIDGLLAVCLQHEMDHLDGVLAVDRAIDRHSLCTRAEWKRRFQHAAP